MNSYFFGENNKDNENLGFSSDSSSSYSNVYNPTIAGRDAELLALTSCVLNVSSSNKFTDSDGNNLPLQVMLMLDEDPFIIAQNMTRGTNLFPGLPKNLEREVGLNFVIGGSVVCALVFLVWALLKFLMQRDEDSARHVFKAFGQEYIPSTQDYLTAIAQGRSYKHSHGFVPLPKNTNKNNNVRKSVSQDREQQQQIETNNSMNNNYQVPESLLVVPEKEVPHLRGDDEELAKMLKSSRDPMPSQKISRK